MGPSPSQDNKQTKENQILVINHPRFNNLKVGSYPTEDDEGTIQIIYPLSNEIEFKKWVEKVSKIKDTDNNFLPIKYRFDKTEFCGSGGIATIIYKYYPYLLRDEIVNRSSMQGKYFEEPELWYLVYSIVLATALFHEDGQKIGDIRPQNIFISPQGQIRVGTQYSWPNEQTNYLKTVFQKQITYLSPQELKDISYGKFDQSNNVHLKESFSVGLTCLDAATLGDSTKLYQNNNKFNYALLDQRLNALQKSGSYSVPLILLIKGLCQVESQKRITCKELIQWLSKYQNNIIQLQQFNITEIPSKLHALATVKQQKPQSHLPIYPNISPGGGYISSNLGPQTPPVYHPTFDPKRNIPADQVARPVSYQPQTIIYGDPKTNQIPVESSSQFRNGNLSIQQIDEHLQRSRKLFPS